MAGLDRDELLTRLGQLPEEARIAFAASVCERLLPNFKAFSMMEGWGDYSLLRSVLDRLWEVAAGEKMRKDEIERLMPACEAVIPDAEDFATIFTGIAQYTVSSLMHTLRYLRDSNLDELAQVGQLGVDSIYEYLGAVAEPSLDSQAMDDQIDEWIKRAPMWEAELNQQRQDLELIGSWQGSSADLMQRLRKASLSRGIQPVRRGMVKASKS